MKDNNSNIKILVYLGINLFLSSFFIYSIYKCSPTHTFNITCINIFFAFLILFFLGFFILFSKAKKTEQFDYLKLSPFISIYTFVTFFVALIAIILLLLKYTIYFTYSFVTSLLQTADKLDKMVLVAIITAIFTIITNLILKFAEYKVSRQNYLAQKREIPYQKFIECFYKLQDARKKYTQQDLLDDLNEFSQGFTLWGSKKVVEKWNEFRFNSTKPNMEEKNLFILEEIMNEM